MSQRYQGGILGVGFNPLQAPNAPTIGTATAGNQNVSVAFTAPANVGGSAISSYRVLANPGGIGATTSSSPVTISGLTNGTTYTFSLAAVNSYGFSPYSGTATATPAALAIEDVFSTSLYTGNGAAGNGVANNINLSGEGGMVWIKLRSGAGDNFLFDTVRGRTNRIVSNSTAAQVSDPGFNYMQVFYSFGFDFGSAINVNAATYASWTFRKAPKFFDVVTYTGNGASNRAIPHNLGVAPGMIIVKATNSTDNWVVYHRSLPTPTNAGLYLNTTAATQNFPFFPTVPDATNFYVNGGGYFNNDGGITYVAYLYAHDTASTGLIQCGSYTGNGSATGPVVTLGWEPQWVMIKRATGGANGWELYDNMRGFTMEADSGLRANTSGAEFSVQRANPTATGFAVASTDTDVNASGETYIYMAIRRGPMKTPTLGTSVFAPVARSGTSANATVTAGFPIDLSIIKNRVATETYNWTDRLRGVPAGWISSASLGGEQINTANILGLDSNTAVRIGNDARVNISGNTYANYFFQRAPGFFDEVCYTGDGTYGTTNHNLGVAPELIITKSRSTTEYWAVDRPNGDGYGGRLNSSAAWTANWGPPNPVATSTIFAKCWDSSNVPYVAYLFASAPGVSKVGTYTGNGSSQTINCAFTTGSRFVMIKRTDSTGDWYVWDSARGIVAGNDPYLALNTTAAEVTSNDSVDTDSTGFVVNQVAASNINVNGATYIFLAIS